MLPIQECLPELNTVLSGRTEAVVVAPTGAGKTTGIPPALLDAEWLGGRRIVMLEPRRLAARAAARRMAAVHGEKVGQTFGYRVRMDSRVSVQTRVEVVTEGVLVRMLQDDPMLAGVGLVIFDEFHERSIQADLALALCLDVQASVREDLRLLVMSATLDGAAVASLLDRAPVVKSEGRLFPVEVRYSEQDRHDRRERIEQQTVAAVRRALREEEGDMLVFLPGAGEIRRVERMLDELPDDVDVRPLFGNLPQHAQDEAIAPGKEGRRKVVLSTDIAETSLTIEGIMVVIDAGLMRVPRFSPASGMTRLETIRVSRASADQRRGRAGRLAPGACYRLWTRHTQHHLEAQTDPEILHADLAPLALDLARWGVASPEELKWLDPPPGAAFAQARDLLQRLEALDEDKRITPHGREMARLGMHPRLAHMVLRAMEMDLGELGCDIAALLGERDIIQGSGGPAEADMRLRLRALRDTSEDRRARLPVGHQLHRGAQRRARRVADFWKKRLHTRGSRADINDCGILLALAYPDRIAANVETAGQAGGRFRLQSGHSVVLTHSQVLSDAEYLVAAYLHDGRGENRIFLAAPVGEGELREHFSGQIETRALIVWDDERSLVKARRQEAIGAVVLKDAPLRDPDPKAMADAMLEGIAASELALLPWTKGARRLQQRLIFLHHHLHENSSPTPKEKGEVDPQGPEGSASVERADEMWPDISGESLLAHLDEWLKPYVYGMKRAADLQQLDLTNILLDRFSWEQRGRLDDLAPTHITVPSGSRRPIDYSDPRRPVLAVRLQEMFGATGTPRIVGGSVALTLHLLSPAQRPVQITQDLAGFWRDTYFDVKKDMKGRYPKHYWPDDPLKATPTSRVRPR